MSTYAEKPQLFIASLAVNALPAILITAVLLLLMHNLIATDMDPPDIQKRKRLEFIGKVPEITVQMPTERPDKPAEVDPQPERLQPLAALHTDDLKGPGRGGFDPVFELKSDVGPGTNMVVPYLKLQPEYPSRALNRGIEGFVDLAFDITAAGATSNIRVIQAQPQGVFERAAIRALEKWKYKVPITDGVAQGQADMMTRLSFKLER